MDNTTKFEEWAKNVDPTELGRCLKEYVAESNHNGWDGWNRKHLTGVRALLEDLSGYYDAGVKANAEYFKVVSSVNPL